MTKTLINEEEINSHLIDSLQDIGNRLIIIDSCILLYCELYDFKLLNRQILRKLKDNNNNLAISEISGFEVLKNSEKQSEKYFVELLDFIPNISVTKGVIINATILHKGYRRVLKCKEYKEEKLPYDRLLMDYIIGGTVLLHKEKNPLLFTCNRRDFPKDLWENFISFPILFWDNDQYKAINYYLLEPRYDIIARAIK